MTDAVDFGDVAPAEASIADHALIGDLRTAALVDRWGRINWLCWPRFDGAPLFRRLVDPESGGCWQLAPSVRYSTRRRYVPDTNVVETTFTCAAGVIVAHDFMALPAGEAGSMVVRTAHALSGDVAMRMVLRATPGFDTGTVAMRTTGAGVTDGERMTVATNAPEPITIQGDTAVLDTVVRQDRPLVMVLSDAGAGEHSGGGELLERAGRARDATVRWWREWLGGAELPGAYTAAVARSALTVKLLHHEGSSSLVAAPTTSLPERIGGGRNWDYRYSWLRDSAMMIGALQRLSHHDEAMAYWGWLARTAERHGGDLAIAYTLDGDPLPGERIVDHLPGHRGSTPVRVGNEARHQRQHDVYGSVLSAASHCYHHMADMDRAMPEEVLETMADLAARRWDRPDDSIWEVRGGRDHHTYSKLMCWLALDRAVDLHRHGALDGDVATWSAQRDAVRKAVLSRAWNATLGAFAGTLDGDRLDAATLIAPLIGFLPADDPRCRATAAAVATHLDDGGLLRRYRYDDGIEGTDNPFLLCTLWLADNHTLAGEPDRGRELLERVLATCNDLGLLGEEADPVTNEPLGNFPQGLTHLGVIDTAHRLDAADRPGGQPEPRSH